MLGFRDFLGAAAALSIVTIALAQGCANGQLIAENDGGGTCASPNVTCGADCVDTTTDSDNCGACGTACTSTQVCSQGKCGSSCGGGETTCMPDGGKAFCATTATDPKNCGACGNACTTGQTCSAGKCSGGSTTCAQGESSCPVDGGAQCFNLQTDNSHCGTCTTVCLANLETCAAGVCGSTCTNGETLCIPDGGVVDGGDGGASAHCADTQTSNTDCGTCFNPCAQGAQCTAGICKSTLLGSGTAADPWHTSPTPANCKAYLTLFPTATDGVYTTHPNAADIGVYCDMTNGGVTYEDFGFGQYSATYTGYAVCSATDFSGSTQFDAAFAYLYDRNAGLTNINPNGWTDENCCIENGATSGSFYGIAGGSYMEPATGVNNNCNTTYSAAYIQLELWPSQTFPTSYTATQAGTVATSTTCSTSGNPAIFVKKY